MQWNEMSPIERNALVAEKVFQRRIYRENTWGQWLLHHETKPGMTETIPHYTESFDAAWPIITVIAQRFDEDSKYLDSVVEIFTDELFDDIASGQEIYPTYEIIPLMATWTPEMLCRIALKAFGVEIEYDRSKHE